MRASRPSARHREPVRARARAFLARCDGHLCAWHCSCRAQGRSTTRWSSPMARRTAMLMRTLSIGAMAISLATSAAVAADLTDRLQAQRMTVVKVDQAGGRFLCAEHRRWTAVDKTNLGSIHPGDIVAVEKNGGRLAHLVLLRAAPDELMIPEQ